MRYVVQMMVCGKWESVAYAIGEVAAQTACMLARIDVGKPRDEVRILVDFDEKDSRN